MIATITKISIVNSRKGGKYYSVILKDSSNKTYITYIYFKMKNRKRWEKVLDVGTTLSNLKLWKEDRNIIDADSNFSVVENKKYE